MDFVRIIVVEIILFIIYCWLIYLDTARYWDRVVLPKKKKKTETELRGDNYPFS